MRSTCWLLLLAGMMAVPETVSAQAYLGPYGYARGPGASAPGARRRVRIRFGVLTSSAYGLAPRAFALSPGGYGLSAVEPLLPPAPGVVRIPAYTPLTTSRQLVVVEEVLPEVIPDLPPADPLDDDGIPPVPGPDVPRRIVPPVPEMPEVPRFPPRDRVPAPPPRELPRPPRELPPPPRELPRPPEGKREPELPRPPGPAEDENDEIARLIARGEEAFGDLEYGRAAQRFRQASRQSPGLARPHFLLAQALVAQGKYHEAYDAIMAGMAVRPDWPRAKFRPLDLYGAAVGDYPEHLQTLEETLRKHPNDPVLLFLFAYQLWFDGRKEEARPLFRRALPRSHDRDAIDRFLRALPAEEV